MVPSAQSNVNWSPALQTHAATTLSSRSSCSLLALCCSHGSLGTYSPLLLAPFRHFHSNLTRKASTRDSSLLNFNLVHSSSHKSSRSTPAQGGVPSPQYHRQNRRIELKRFRVILQNGELRFRRKAKVGDDLKVESESSMDGQFGVTETRRDLLMRLSSAVVLAVANFLSSGSKESAEASVSQRVRLKDVENQKLQHALRAAVAGDLENAEILFTEIIKEEPTSASGWSNRGSVRISLGKFELATDDFTKAIELAPQAPVPYLNRAISYEVVGRFDEAIADCKTAIENDPEEPAAWYNLGNVEARVKDFDTSLIAYQRASILAPGIAGYRLRHALVLFQVGKLEESKKLLQGLVRKYPNYTEAHAALAALLWSEGQRSNAEDQFSEATMREPLYSKISWVEEELQWPPGVLQAFSKFLSID